MNSIQLLTKAGQVIDELARSGSATPAELAKAVSEPRPTVYRIASALQQLELVRSAGDGRLELGVGLLRWGDAAVEAFIDRRELHKQLCWIQEQVGMNAYFCVPGERGPLCLDQVAGAVVDLVDLGPGRTLPNCHGAVSLALLAFQSPEVQAEAPAAAERACTDSNGHAPGASLRARLDRVAEAGWSSDDCEVVEGIASVAVPLRADTGEVVAVVAAAGLRASILPQAESTARVLEVAARALTASMSGPRRPAESGTEPPIAGRRTGTTAPALILKAGALMQALAEQRVTTSARLTELIDEPASSVYRMLATLTQIGWIEQISRRGAYRVGGKVLTITADFTRRLDIRRAAQPVLAQIHAAFGETTFLCVRHGTRAVCIERIDGIRVNSRVLRIGRSLPLHVGAAPRALLAFEDKEAWDEYASSAALDGDLLRDVGSRSELYAQLEEVRASGVVVSDNTVTPGIAAVGAPILDHYGRVAASLSVSGLREGILAESRDGGPSVRELVQRGARELSHYLGWDGSSGEAGDSSEDRDPS